MAEGDRSAIFFSTVKKYVTDNNKLLMELAETYETLIDGNDYEYAIGADGSGEARWEEVQEIENENANDDDRSPAEIVYYDNLITINNQLQRGIEILLERIAGGYYDIENAEAQTEETMNQWSHPFAYQDLTTRKPIDPAGGMLIGPAPMIWYGQKESAIQGLTQLREINRRIANLRINTIPGWYEVDWDDRAGSNELLEDDSYWSLLNDFLSVGKIGNAISSYYGEERLPWAVMHWIYMIIEQQDRRLPKGLRWYDINGLAYNRQGVKQFFETLEPLAIEYFNIASKGFGPPIDKTNPDVVELWQMAKGQWRILAFYVQHLRRMSSLLDELPRLTPRVDSQGHVGIHRTGGVPGGNII
ncbi:hypothetical protein AA313_de0207661 [Arthrobotrys entomopaga]|nr:hypothetical protein AA313_de0207661 [Arthrobotrys entomopaga]